MPTAIAKTLVYDRFSERWIATAEVTEADGSVEMYVGTVANDDAFKTLSSAQKKARLVAAVRASRDERQAAASTSPAWSGNITV